MLQKVYKVFIFPYTLFLLYLMFFGFGRTQYDDNVLRLIPLNSTFSFVENSILYSRYWSVFINIFGNIGMFIPFGFLGWIFLKFQNLKELMVSFLSLIVIVEAFQYFTRLGVFDIDDVILNSFGVWLGFLLKKKFKLFRDVKI